MDGFHFYTRRERIADGLMHGIGLPLGVFGLGWMLWRLMPHGSGRQVLAVCVYGAGLVGMLAASAAYNLWPHGSAKALMRRADHAMIFVMIAGSYTPYALCALPPGLGWWVLAAVWGVAAVGVTLRMAVGNRYRGAFVVLYLVQGWMVLGVLPSLAGAVPGYVLALLVGGGVVYSVGAFVHTRERWRFHNAIWHGLVLVAAGLHWRAIVGVLGL